MRRAIAVGVCASLTLLAPGAMASQPTEAKVPETAAGPTIVPTLLTLPTGSWSGQRFLAADRHGRVFVLRAETLEVYPATASLHLGEPFRLAPQGGLGEPPSYVRSAAMGDDPARWLVLGRDLRLYDDGEVLRLEGPNQPIYSVLFVRDDPIALLAPARLRTRSEESLEQLPTLAEWTGHDWVPRFEESIRGIEGPRGVGGSIVRRALHVADGDRLWLAQTYTPRLRRISPGGRVELDLVTDGGRPLERPAAARQSMQEEMKRAAPQPTRADRKVRQQQVQVNPYEAFHRAIALDRSGGLYLLVGAPDGEPLRLRRWNVVTQQLDEVVLAKVDVPGLASLVFGREGLYVATSRVNHPAYFVSNEALDTAEWRPVDEQLLDGFEAVPNDTERGE